MSQPLKVSFDEFAQLHCSRMVQTPEKLLEILEAQAAEYQPTGWMLLECQMFDSSTFGHFTIFPYGPNNSFKEIPTHPVSPRGLASDMSVATHYTLAAELPDAAAPWTPPPEAEPKPKARKKELRRCSACSFTTTTKAKKCPKCKTSYE
jgi:hypothetical protein